MGNARFSDDFKQDAVWSNSRCYYHGLPMSKQVMLEPQLVWASKAAIIKMYLCFKLRSFLLP